MLLSTSTRRGNSALAVVLIPIALMWQQMTPGLKAALVLAAAWVVFSIWNAARVSRQTREEWAQLERLADEYLDHPGDYARGLEAPSGRSASPPHPPRARPRSAASATPATSQTPTPAPAPTARTPAPMPPPRLS